MDIKTRTKNTIITALELRGYNSPTDEQVEALLGNGEAFVQATLMALEQFKELRQIEMGYVYLNRLVYLKERLDNQL